MKKIVKVLLLSILFLIACWGIGRVTHPTRDTDISKEADELDNTDNADFQNDVNENNNNQGISVEDYLVTFENSIETTDNPWGVTAGVVEDDEIGNCIFLTPNTGFTIKGLDNTSVVSLQAELYPSVAESSDGAGIVVWVMDDNEEILYEDHISITKDDNWVDISYSLDGILNASQIRFMCNNGDNNDDICDWVVFKDNN